MTGHVIHVDRHIYATPQQVWNVLTDLAHTAEVVRSVQNVQVIDGGEEFGIGTRWREDRTLMGHKGTEELEVVEAEPPKHFALRTTRDRDQIQLTYTLTPMGGSTRLSLTLVDDMHSRKPASALAWTLWGEVSLHSTRRMLAHDLDDVAMAAEKVAISNSS